MVHLKEFIGFNDLHDLEPAYLIRHFPAVKNDNLLEDPIDREKDGQRRHQAAQDHGIVKPGQGSNGDIVKICPEWLQKFYFYQQKITQAVEEGVKKMGKTTEEKDGEKRRGNAYVTD